MNRRIVCIHAFLLTAALTTPAALRASALPNSSRRPANLQQDNRQQGRVYDQQRHEWHDWNENEERAYRQFLAENRRDYREFARLSDREQSEYWNWRHSHPDRDDRDARGDRPPTAGRYYDESARDYHEWSDNEERAYREYLGDRHRDYVQFYLLVPRDQQDYWVWRHGHPDHDDRDNRGGPGRRYYDQNTGQYHDWNDNEDRAYHRFMDENHRQYVDFDHADLSIQLQFWLWRQFHPDGYDRPVYRSYDDDRHEHHEWNEREEGAYRSFLTSISRPYIEFSVAGPDIQVRYWSWRREHPDDDQGPRRYLDARRNQWHVWDDREEQAYRQFMNERHWPYRELYVLLPRDQQRYWDWRHDHPDRDRDRH